MEIEKVISIIGAVVVSVFVGSFMLFEYPERIVVPSAVMSETKESRKRD